MNTAGYGASSPAELILNAWLQARQWTGFHIRHRVAKQFCIYPVWQAVKGIPGTLMLTWGCYI